MNDNQHYLDNEMSDNSIPEFSDIPSGYFEGLKTELLHRVDEGLTPVKKFTTYQKSWKVAAALVILVGLASVLYFLIKPGNQQNHSQLAQNQSHFVADSLNQQSTTAVDSLAFGEHAPPEQDSMWLNQLSDDDIIMYLIELEEFEF